MANQKKNPLVLFLLAAVIVLAIFFIVRAAKPKKSSPRQQPADRTSEEGDFSLPITPQEVGPIKCPKDGGEAVRTAYYECGVHDHRFEAYRMKPTEGSEQMLYKVPGGEWTKVFPEIVCPHGNDDPKTLKPSPPKS